MDKIITFAILVIISVPSVNAAEEHLVFNGISYHTKPSPHSYDWNEENWGLGYQKKFKIKERIPFTTGYTIGILKDSHRDWLPYGGWLAQRRWHTSSWDIELGAALLLNRRRHINDSWNLIPTPVASLSHGRSSLNMIFIYSGAFSDSSALLFQYAFQLNALPQKTKESKAYGRP